MVNVITVVSILLWLALPSCQKDPSKSEAARSLSAKEAPGQRAARFGWLPPGTVWKTERRILRAKGPEGWNYIGYDVKGNLLHAPNGVMKSISCTCNTSGSCKPFHATGPAGSTDGCTGTCSNCTMKQSITLGDRQYLLHQGGYYNPTAAITVLKPGEVASAVFDALITELPAFREQLMRFIARAHYGSPMALPVKNPDGSITAPKGYGLVAISIMGRGLVTVVPEAFAKSQPGMVLMNKASCDCSKGGCSLKDRTILGTGAIWCDGDCTGTCTLTTKSDESAVAPIRIFSYAY